MSNRIGVLDPRDRAAFFETAQRLQIDPYQLGAVIHQESGFRPNIWGGQGGRHYGLIQFGGPERSEAGLDPSKIGKYTIREQLPHVEKWLAGRGYRPGMGVQKLYATILGGNPNANIYASDSFGTTVADSLKRFVPGGSLYTEAQKILGDPLYGSVSSTSPEAQQTNSGTATDILKNTLIKNLLGNILASPSTSTVPSFPAPPLPSFDEESESILTNSQNKGLSNQDIFKLVLNSGKSYTDQTTNAIRELAVKAQEAFKPGKSVF